VCDIHVNAIGSISTPSGNTVTFAILVAPVSAFVTIAVVFPSFCPVTSPVFEILAILLFPML